MVSCGHASQYFELNTIYFCHPEINSFVLQLQFMEGWIIQSTAVAGHYTAITKLFTAPGISNIRPISLHPLKS